jgi:imidazolonepropionase
LHYKNDHDGYINLIIDVMLPQIAQEKLADYVDVFCEKDFFSPEETIKICQAARQYGLKPKLHANQLHCSGGVQAGVAMNAVSVDHLESMRACHSKPEQATNIGNTSTALFSADAISTCTQNDIWSSSCIGV